MTTVRLSNDSSLHDHSSIAVPVYDVRTVPFDINTDLSLSNDKLPLFEDDIPRNSFVIVAYTAAKWIDKSRQPQFSANLHWIIVVGIPAWGSLYQVFTRTSAFLPKVSWNLSFPICNTNPVSNRCYANSIFLTRSIISIVLLISNCSSPLPWSMHNQQHSINSHSPRHPQSQSNNVCHCHLSYQHATKLGGAGLWRTLTRQSNNPRFWLSQRDIHSRFLARTQFATALKNMPPQHQSEGGKWLPPSNGCGRIIPTTGDHRRS